jgi:hypothetical protein
MSDSFGIWNSLGLSVPLLEIWGWWRGSSGNGSVGGQEGSRRTSCKAGWMALQPVLSHIVFSYWQRSGKGPIPSVWEVCRYIRGCAMLVWGKACFVNGSWQASSCASTGFHHWSWGPFWSEHSERFLGPSLSQSSTESNHTMWEQHELHPTVITSPGHTVTVWSSHSQPAWSALGCPSSVALILNVVSTYWPLSYYDLVIFSLSNTLLKVTEGCPFTFFKVIRVKTWNQDQEKQQGSQ